MLGKNREYPLIWISDKMGIPKKALRDAAHLAVASVHNIDYLVTMKRKVSMKFLKE